jgi:hypothetical protein
MLYGPLDLWLGFCLGIALGVCLPKVIAAIAAIADSVVKFF